MTAPVRVGVVGLGYWGPNLLRNFHELPESDMACVCDVREEMLEKAVRRFPGVRRTTDFQSMLADPTIEAIAIATPLGTHYPLARAALTAGKHVFVEKPLAASSAAASALMRLADEQDLLLMPGHTFLYSPPVNAIRELIASGKLGEIYFISSSRVNLGLHQPDVSVVWDLGPHDFSILQYWLDGPPVAVSANSRSCVIPGIPDVAFVDLEFSSGTIANVHLAWLAPSKLRQTVVVGSERMVVYDDTSTEPVRIFDSGVVFRDPETFGEYKLTYRTGDIVSPRVASVEPLALELADFCDSIRSGTEPRSNAQVGLEVLGTIEAVDRSLALEGARVSLDKVLATVR